MSLTAEQKRDLSTKGRLGALLADGEATAFWQEVAAYLERRREEIRNEGFAGDPEELAAHQARENELAQLIEWIAEAKAEGIAAAKDLEKNRRDHGEG